MIRRPPISTHFPYTTLFFFFTDTATTEIYTLSLPDALPIPGPAGQARGRRTGDQGRPGRARRPGPRSEEHTSELQSRGQLVCRLLLEKKKKKTIQQYSKNKKK